MKKIISFKKELEFSSMIGEVTAISLDDNLKFVDESNITGEFTVSGKYKLTEASRIEDDFSFKIPAEIILNEKLDLKTAKIEIADFYYEIENDDTMVCYIDVKVEGLELIEEEKERCIEEEDEPPKKEPEKETSPREEIVQNTKENKMETDKENNISTTEEQEINKTVTETTTTTENVGALFSSLKDAEETFSTYSIYIVREEETVQSIIEKYKTTKEELEKYNDLSSLKIGTKLIIPTTNENWSKTTWRTKT